MIAVIRQGDAGHINRPKTTPPRTLNSAIKQKRSDGHCHRIFFVYLPARLALAGDLKSDRSFEHYPVKLTTIKYIGIGVIQVLLAYILSLGHDVFG